MLFSFFVAVMLTPWLMVKMRGKWGRPAPATAAGYGDALGRIYRRISRRSSSRAARRRCS